MAQIEQTAPDVLSPDSSDTDLVEALQNGIDRAWPLLLRRYSSLITSAAHTYARTCRSPDSYETREDTASGLYLCMIERLRDSIVNYYRGECQLKTWIYRLIGDRRQIVKAYLMQTDQGRHRADTRLPRVIQKHSSLDQEIYRRLVWGKDSSWIAWDLGLSEVESHEMCADIMQLLRNESPRVYRRIMANRRALQPSISLDRPLRNDDGETMQIQAEDDRPLPDALTEQKCLLERLPHVERIIHDAVLDAEEDDIRLLILVFDQGWSLAEVVDQAAVMGFEDITARHQVDYRVTRVLRTIAQGLCDHIGAAEHPEPESCRDEVITALKVLFRDRGVGPYLPDAVAGLANETHNEEYAA